MRRHVGSTFHIFVLLRGKGKSSPLSSDCRRAFVTGKESSRKLAVGFGGSQMSKSTQLWPCKRRKKHFASRKIRRLTDATIPLKN